MSVIEISKDDHEAKLNELVRDNRENTIRMNEMQRQLNETLTLLQTQMTLRAEDNKEQTKRMEEMKARVDSLEQEREAMKKDLDDVREQLQEARTMNDDLRRKLKNTLKNHKGEIRKIMKNHEEEIQQILFDKEEEMRQLMENHGGEIQQITIDKEEEMRRMKRLHEEEIQQILNNQEEMEDALEAYRRLMSGQKLRTIAKWGSGVTTIFGLVALVCSAPIVCKISVAGALVSATISIMSFVLSKKCPEEIAGRDA